MRESCLDLLLANDSTKANYAGFDPTVKREYKLSAFKHDVKIFGDISFGTLSLLKF